MDLVNYCRELASAANSASAWVERNGEVVRNERESLLKELRRARRLFRSCEKAAGRKMCAGVFGPSQAGKSYLISALARGASNSLDAVFGRQTHDFISEINPEGGKESTGLVTRFTMSADENAPDDYPVVVRLLSEMDLVKIIANTYYADCEHKEAFQSDIAATLEKLGKLPAVQKSHIDLDAMEDLREYVTSNFRAKPGAQELERTYWERAVELAPGLDLEGRIQLYALIWDEVEEFTGLLRKLLKPLEALGHPETLYCAMDALVPRAQSIIDVATLEGLENDDIGGTLDVCSLSGASLRLPRAVVTALTAELTITMAEKPAEYFGHTDLLDFPGYRSRYKLEDVRHELKKTGMLKELFLRGKVAYLFQRYCAERELNSMLLCIGPGNQEVQDLPGVINDWVCSTHGSEPEDREGKKASLLFILTKFDMEFEDKKGAPSLEARWDNRLHASLLDFFGKQHDWPARWTPNRGFDNIFMLRNPNFRFEAIMDFAGDVEKGIRPQRQDYVNRLEAAFMGSSLVREHFKDPATAWKEAMRLNDGGISYIRQSLSPLCDPQIRQDQLLQNVNACREGIFRRLKAFYQSDDREELRKQKLNLVVSLFQSLGRLEKQRQRLGPFLKSLTVRDTEIYDLHPEALRRFRSNAEEANISAPETDDETVIKDADFATLDLDAFNPFAESREEEKQQTDNSAHPIMDEAAFFAAYIESKWVEKLHRMADDPILQSFYMLSAQQFSALAGELATGAERLGFREEMATAFRLAAAYANTGKAGIVRKQSAIAANIINSYVDWLGYNPQTQTAAQRMVELPGGKKPVVFEPPEEIKGIPHLGETARQYTWKWYQDWLNALAGMILENVNFDGKQTFNVAENTALGTLLQTFSKAA